MRDKLGKNCEFMILEKQIHLLENKKKEMMNEKKLCEMMITSLTEMPN